MTQVRIIGGEFANHGGLPSGMNAQAEMDLRSPGPCPVCGAPHTTCTGDTQVVLLDDVDPMVRLLVDATASRPSPGAPDRVSTFFLGLADSLVRRSLAQYGPEGCYEEIPPVDEDRP